MTHWMCSPVHGVGGILGTFAAGIFASAGLGVFSGQGFNEGMTMGSQVGVQLIGIVSTVVYTGGTNLHYCKSRHCLDWLPGW